METQASDAEPLSGLRTALKGRYEIGRELGRGGMATVYLARDLRDDRMVALKVLLPDLAATLAFDRFHREIDVGTTLQHPRIVGVLDSGEVGSTLYYTMPFVDGASLRDRLKREKQLSIDDALAITGQVADALAYAHSHGVIHRDIKPENILLNEQGAMVADFGIARAVTAAGGESLTRTGTAVGTPTYMSPEQAAGSKDAAPESDIYSLACVLYEMLAGQPPFTGPTVMALLARHSLDTAPSLRIVRSTIPDAVEDAIIKALAKVPTDRFHSASAFAAALSDHEGAAIRRRDSMRHAALASQTDISPRRAPRRMAMMAALAVPLLIGGSYAGWKFTHAATPAEGLTGDFAKSSIAVLYFDDRSPGKELSHVADGLTESLINELSAVKELRVVSSNGVNQLRGRRIPSDSIAWALKVGTLVMGTVTPIGDKLRVKVSLVDALGDDVIDTKEFDQPRASAMELQDSLAHEVSLLLRERLGNTIQELVSRVGTRSAEAWEAMQRARQTIAEGEELVRAKDIPAAMRKLTAADGELAAVEHIDSRWTDPTAQRGWLAYRRSRLAGSTDPAFVATIDSGLAHADRALRKAPNDAGAIELRGTLHYWQWLNNLSPNEAAAPALLASAEQDLRTAVAANRTKASAWNVLSHLLINKSQLSEAKLAAENAYKADPYLTDVDRTILRLFLASLDLGIREEATRWCSEGERRFPGSYRFVECRLWLNAMKGATPDIPEVWKVYDAYVQASPANVQEFDRLKGRMMVALALVRAGLPDSAKALAAKSLGDPEIDPRGELTNLASIVYAQSGDHDTALKYIARYLAANPQQRAFAATDDSWWLSDLRADPRYQALVKGSE